MGDLMVNVDSVGQTAIHGAISLCDLTWSNAWGKSNWQRRSYWNIKCAAITFTPMNPAGGGSAHQSLNMIETGNTCSISHFQLSVVVGKYSQARILCLLSLENRGVSCSLHCSFYWQQQWPLKASCCRFPLKSCRLPILNCASFFWR